MKKLSDISINTIEVFCLIYLKGSTINVANDLSISQSKVSRALSALREVFADPLFIRKNNRLVATELTHNIYPLLTEILSCSRAIESHEPAKPSSTEPPVVIATVPQLEIGLAQKIVKDAVKLQQSPNIAISTTAWSDRSEQQLIDGEIDVAICFKPSTRKELLSKPIIQHKGGYLIAQSQHPIWDDTCVDNIINYPIVKLVTMPFPANKSPIGAYAAAVGRPMAVYAVAPDLGSAASSLLNSKAIIIVGVKAAADFLSNINGLTSKKMQYSEDDLLLKGFSPPTVYLWLKRNADGKVAVPIWFQQILEAFIIESHK